MEAPHSHSSKRFTDEKTRNKREREKVITNASDGRRARSHEKGTTDQECYTATDVPPSFSNTGQRKVHRVLGFRREAYREMRSGSRSDGMRLTTSKLSMWYTRIDTVSDRYEEADGEWQLANGTSF